MNSVVLTLSNFNNSIVTTNNYFLDIMNSPKAMKEDPFLSLSSLLMKDDKASKTTKEYLSTIKK